MVLAAVLRLCKGDHQLKLAILTDHDGATDRISLFPQLFHK